jgi:hypothetical protein
MDDGTLFSNTICVVCEDGGNLEKADAGEIIDACESWLKTEYLAMLCSRWTLAELVLRGIRAQDGVLAAKSESAAGTLYAGTDDLPKEICQVMTIRTNYAKRSGHGRIFIPSPLKSAALQTNNTWKTSDTYWTHAATFGDKLLAQHSFSYGTLGGFTGNLVCNVYSRVHDEIHEMSGYVRRPNPHWLRSRATSP